MAPKKDTPSLDVYASPYVPLALKSFNQRSAAIVRSHTARGVDYQAYVRSFAGTDILASPPETHPHLTATTHDQNGSQTKTVSPQNYAYHFRDALACEAEALQHECDEYSLYQVPLLFAARDPRPFMYWLQVPGLRETSLRIENGDIVKLRQLHFGPRGELLDAPFLMYNAQGGVVTSPYVNAEYHSVVWGIDRLNERLTLRVDWLEQMSMQFNVYFTVQAGRSGALHRAVVDAGQSMPLAVQSSWMRSMLFPEPSDGAMQKSLNKGTIGWDARDPLLNYEQIRAIDNVLGRDYGTVPYIISGPPGTGKTKTLVELALQLISGKPDAHLLVCAPSDPAADILTKRLRQHLSPKELLRLNATSRSFPEVPMNILPFCYVDTDMFSIPPFRQMMRYQIVVTTCRDAEMLLQARMSNMDLSLLEQNMQSALHPERDEFSPLLHWTGLLMDEAAQATEPEACIPLCVVALPHDFDSTSQTAPIFVKAGDQNQLGPRTASKGQAIQTSLFERLLQRPIYSEHPLARTKQSGGVMRPLTQAMLPILRPPFANLIRNYRSHPAILATPSALFYSDTLEPEAKNTDSLLAWKGWKGR